jgi:cytidylate kinase
VLPDARAKVFLDASVEVRANRRFIEVQKDNGTLTYQNILDDLIKRDQIDSQRSESPLEAADDALILDTKDMTIEQVVESIMNELSNR